MNTHTRADRRRERHTHFRDARAVLVLSASASATPPSAPRLLPLRLEWGTREHMTIGHEKEAHSVSHSLKGFEGVVGLERFCKRSSSLGSDVIAFETGHGGHVSTYESGKGIERHTHLREVRELFVLSASATASAGVAPPILPKWLSWRLECDGYTRAQMRMGQRESLGGTLTRGM